MKRILSVDDDPWVLETLKDALTPRGYEVITTTSPDEAERLISQEKFDLVLLDLGMPGKNGFVLYRELEALQQVPVLFVSGCSRSFAANSEQFVTLWTNEFLNGTTDILYKPFALETLYEKVEALIGCEKVIESEPAQ
jgi:DNA-binding response OmpR family regulator